MVRRLVENKNEKLFTSCGENDDKIGKNHNRHVVDFLSIAHRLLSDHKDFHEYGCFSSGLVDDKGLTSDGD